MFIPSNGLTPEERLIDAQQGAFSRLMKEELDEHKKTTVNKPDQVQENDEAAQGLLTNAKDTSVCLSLQFLCLAQTMRLVLICTWAMAEY